MNTEINIKSGREKLMRAIDCCIEDNCKGCPTNTGQDNCIMELLKGAKEYILHLETNESLAASDFAKFLIERSENGVVDISNLADLLKEWKEKKNDC